MLPSWAEPTEARAMMEAIVKVFMLTKVLLLVIECRKWKF